MLHLIKLGDACNIKDVFLARSSDGNVAHSFVQFMTGVFWLHTIRIKEGENQNQFRAVEESTKIYHVSFYMYHKRLQNKVRNLILKKMDWSERFVNCAVSSKHSQCIWRNAKKCWWPLKKK